VSFALDLAAWAAALAPNDADRRLADRALADTVAVSIAARGAPLLTIAHPLGTAGRLAVAAHLLDYDDLHLPSTSHISAICVPATVAVGGDARAYLAAAGVMARLGSRLGWAHYGAGWHATCTAGAPAAAIAAGIAAGLDVDGLARAIALAVPAAGGNHRAFGTHAKALQVGFAVDAGVRAAALAKAGATVDLETVDAWLALVGAAPEPVVDHPDRVGPAREAGAEQADRVGLAPEAAADQAEGDAAVPGGLAIKLHPCCYALQRPIAAVRAAVEQAGPLTAEAVSAITFSAPEGTLRPLIHDRPSSGLQAKFSLPYAAAAAVLDDSPGLASFTDGAVARPQAQKLLGTVTAHVTPGGDDLLAGAVVVELSTAAGPVGTAVVEVPPGAPSRPPTEAELARKLRDCAGTGADAVAALTWEIAAAAVPVLVLG
jgi:2-methylcitrate dehydratase PrpD